MSFIDKAKDFAEKNSDKVNAAIDKAGDLIDEPTIGIDTWDDYRAFVSRTTIC